MGYQGWCTQQYGGNVGSWNDSYCGGDYYGGYCGHGQSSTFVLIVVLFILLIIVGATFM
ncbi:MULTISPECIES: YjcZ family sporulation protein [unclassified Lysinibacillus]|uniref:YjcZ family sporulation protein n=1 Tax=unclassified Lysinibacillus TaxID=2636778 RepID=UPI00255321B9|nr:MULTISPECIES: YjcZ family sporulation protein [unclassified Lysinibacillus]MDM5246600.1 YjcZ family sporulation protein [Lysinibacillus sp. G4S2]